MPEYLEDPIALFEAEQAAAKRKAASDKEYAELTRRLFNSVKGRKWLALAMARTNFMGSVFHEDDANNATNAAKRDGRRAFISDILNAAFDGKTKPTKDHDDDE